PATARPVDAVPTIATRLAVKQKRESCITDTLPMRRAFLRVRRHAGPKSLLNGRRDGCDHVRCLVEGLVPVRDSVSVRNPGEICIQNPHITLLILIHKKPNRPVEPRCWIGGQEQCSERRISEHEKRGWAQRYASIGCELRLINLVEERDALVGHVLLQALDRFS